MGSYEGMRNNSSIFGSIDKKTWISILGIAITLRVLFLMLSIQLPELQSFIRGRDAAGYEQLARNIWEEQEFRFTKGGPTTFRMPGYPLFLAFTSILLNNPLPAQLLQIITDLLLIGVVILMARNISKNPTVAFMAASLIAINPLLALSSISIYPETLSTLFLLLSLLILIKFKNLANAGIFASIFLTAAIYLKPSFSYVGIFLLTIYAINYLKLHGLSLKTSVYVILPPVLILLLLSPWIIRNYIVMRAFIPLTTSFGSNIYGGNNYFADGGYASKERYVLFGMSEIESENEFTSRAIYWIRRNPDQFINLLPAKAVRLISPFYFGTEGAVPFPTTVYHIGHILLTIFYLLAILGLYSLIYKKRYYEAIIFMASPLILLGISLVTFGASRFFIPVYPIISLLAALGFVTVYSKELINKISSLLVSGKKKLLTYPNDLKPIQ
jgi:hypothetical protein